MSLLKIRQFSIDQSDTFTFANANVTGNLNSGNANLGNLAIANYFSGSGNNLSNIQGANISGQVSNALIAGTVYTNAQPNITSVGTLTGVTVSNSTGTVNFTGTGNVTLGTISNLHISGGTAGYVLSTDGSGGLSWVQSSSGTGNANVAGSNTYVFFNDNGSNTLGASANFAFDKSTKTLTVDNISANGSGLSSITGANVTGAVAYAGTANAVAGANVSGAVSYATTANSVAGANVSGAVAYATTANAVAGANVTGAVGLATYATTANAVAGANVSGAVAYATTANSVAGANVSGEVSFAATANAVAGANVSGQVANALVAGTVYGAAQSNITSVGTLTGLTSTGVVDLTGASNVSLGAVGNLHITGGTTGQVLVTNGSGGLSFATNDSGKIVNGTSEVSIPTINGNVVANVGGTTIVTISSSGASITGNITAGNANLGNLAVSNYFSGSGNLLSNIQGGNVSGEVSFAATANAVAGANVSGAVAYATTANAVAGANVSGQVSNALVAGTVYTASQPNITSVGTLTSLSAGDTTITGNLTVSGSFEYANVTSFRVKDPIIEQGGNTSGGALTSNDGYDRGQVLHYYAGGSAVDAFMGWDNSNGEFAFSSNASISSEVATFNTFGNVRAGYYFGNGSLLTGVSADSAYRIANGTSNINVPTVDGNVVIGVSGNAGIVTITGTGVNVAGYVNATGNITGLNANLGNLATANYFSGSGNLLSNIQGANVSGAVGLATYATTANAVAGANVSGAVAYATTANAVAGANVSGEVSFAATANAVAGANVSGQVSNALVAGTVYTAAQPNITSTGTLTGLTVTGNVALSGANVTLGAVGNLHIGGGSANYYLKTDGSGALSWASIPSTTMNVDTFTGDGSWTMKTLTATPADINYTLVAIGGVFQPRDSYSLTGAVITFDDPPPNGAIVEITTVTAGAAGGGGGGGGASWTYSAVSTNTSAVAGYRYIVDTNTANITITLPSSGTLGDEIMIIDGTGNASVHEITVGRNGGKIQGSAADMTVTTDRAAFTLVYYNSTQGWILTNV